MNGETRPLSGIGDDFESRVRSLRLPEPKAPASRSATAWMLCLLLAGSTAWLGFREWQRSAAPSIGQNAAQNAASSAQSAKATSDGGSARNSASVGSSKSKEEANAANSDPADRSGLKPGDIALEAKGYIIPNRQILVSPKVSGMLQQLFIEEGMVLKKNDVIAILESDEYRFERDRAKASYESAFAKWKELSAGYEEEEKLEASADTDEAKAQEKQLELAYRRVVSLRRSSSSSADEVEQAEASWKAMAARVRKLASKQRLVERGYRAEKTAAAKADAANAKAELDRSEWRLENCTIKAPVDGVVLSKKSEQGNMVNPVAFQGSFSICELADLADLEVELSIQERDFSKIRDGQKCKVRPEAWPDRVYDGVAQRMPIGDRAKGAVPVRVRVTVPREEAGQYLRPEMGAVVAFLAG